MYYNIDETEDMLSEISQSQKDIYYDSTSMKYLE